MDNQTFQKIKETLAAHASIGVIVGKNPSVDQMGAGLGLYLVLEKLGKQLFIASPTPPTVEISSLVGIDKVKQTLSGEEGDLMVSFPYKEGEIEKVSYTLENGLLNIVVKAGEKGLSFTQSDISFTRSGTMPNLLFVVGIQHIEDISSIIGPDELQQKTIINIDNVESNEKFGSIVVVSDKFSSVSEQIADFLTLLEPQVTIDIDAAQNLLSGISFATQDFTEQKTSYLAFEMAGILMRKGAMRLRKSTKEIPAQEVRAFFPPKQQEQKKRSEYSAPSQSQRGNQQPTPSKQPPADWLTPKVYKGSTII